MNEVEIVLGARTNQDAEAREVRTDPGASMDGFEFGCLFRGKLKGTNIKLLHVGAIRLRAPFCIEDPLSMPNPPSQWHHPFPQPALA